MLIPTFYINLVYIRGGTFINLLLSLLTNESEIDSSLGEVTIISILHNY